MKKKPTRKPIEKQTKVPVLMRALIARINRRLKSTGGPGADYEMLKAVRGARAQMDLGEYYLVNLSSRFATETHVDPEALGREMGVLQPWEAVIEKGGA